VLLMDEPATHLDITHQLEVYGLARALAAEGQLVLMVCHDLLLAPLFADDCVLMVTGELLAHGPADVALAPENLRRAYGCAVAIRWETAAIAIHAQFSRP
jgi:iron complex transport system ATP-binding protein